MADNALSSGAGDERTRIQEALEEALVATGVEGLTLSEGESQIDDCDSSKDVADQPSPPDYRPKKAATVEWADVTTDFTAAAQCLSHGELVHGPSFNLFDAMSAIELMDSQMDPTVQWAMFLHYPRSLEEAVKKGVLKFDHHTPQELVGVIDEVFACVATWLRGHSLAQTVFTCIYLLDVEKIENIHLRAFAQGLIKTVEYMRACICMGRVYSEDDQQGVCFGFDMLLSLSEASVLVAIKESEDKLVWICKQLSLPQDSERDDGLRKCDLEAWRALLSRIKFTRSLVQFVVSIGKNNAKGIEDGIMKLSQCHKFLDQMMNTLEIGVKVKPESPIELGFHPVINQHLLPPSYKPYGIVSRSTALELLHTIIAQIQQILGFGKIDNFRELYTSVKRFCCTEQCPNVLVRSLIILICLQGDRNKLFGSPSLDALLRDDAKHMVAPPSLNARSAVSTTSKTKESLNNFFGRVGIIMNDYLKIFCQHRARQKRDIIRCLDLLGELQHEAERLDSVLHTACAKLDPQRQHLACYMAWILYYIILLMIEFINIGFEHNLYSPFEFHYVYWYLEYLYGWYFTTKKSADSLIASEPQGAKGKRKTARKTKNASVKEREKETAVLHVKRLLCLGIMRGLEALLLDNKIPQPSFEFGGPKNIFHNRFFPFIVVATPQALAYSDYRRLACVENYRGKNLNLYESSTRHLSSAKLALESIPYRNEELEGLAKIIKTNFVVMTLASKGHKKDSQVAATFDFTAHKHFPIIRLN